MEMSNSSGYLNLAPHEIYWERFGCTDGLPVLFFHGGPGGGFRHDYVELFDLTRINLITFDQRGTGRSKPFGSLVENNTDNLLSDAEALRSYLNIDKWVVTGHSWGATLAIYYAEKFQERCLKVILASYFSGKSEDQDWSLNGVRRFVPYEIEHLEQLKPTNFSGSLSSWILTQLKSPKVKLALKKEIIFRFKAILAKTTRLNPNPLNKKEINQTGIWNAITFFHYVSNDFFISHNISFCDIKVEVIAVHGLFDLDCPIVQLYALKKEIPHLDIIETKGSHSIFEEPMRGVYKSLFI